MNAQVKNLPSTERRSVLLDMSERYGMEPGAFEATVRATCLPPDRDGRQASREEFAAFLLVAKEYDLNPLTKEIYGFRAKNGAIVPIVSVDGWSNIINSNPALDGIEFDDHLDGKNLTAITARIWRKDRSKPTVVTEYMDECRRDPEKTPWGRWPRRMLRHKALIQCARYAFGLAGIYDPDEAERMGVDVSPMRNVTPRDSGPPVPPRAIQQASPQAEAVDAELPENLAPTTAPGDQGEFANWRNDTEGALSGCEDFASLAEIDTSLIKPAKGKVSADDWQAVALVFKQTFDRLSMAE